MVPSGARAASPFTDVAPGVLAMTGERLVTPEQYRLTQLDYASLVATLESAPLEGSALLAERAVLELPLADGTTGRFAIVESPVMAPELQAQFPEIRTYAGYGLDDGTATMRCDLTPHGFHAIILSGKGSMYIDPLQRGDVVHYQSYFGRDHVSSHPFACTVVDEDNMAAEIDRLIGTGPVIASGQQLRTYRLANAATGEYTQFFGGTVPLGLAAVVTSVNRVSGVYEREVHIRFSLIPNNSLIIYTNPATDPYTNNDGAVMLGQNQSNLDAVIGSANYDIGHVFSTGGGGIAGLGVVCRTGVKARGVTGSPSPVGDNFDIDYVAHEMGHQFGGNHSFNGTAGSCGSARVAGAAYEPGSGSTIMAYAGICGAHNLQPHSDDYFVFKSYDEIIAYSTAGSGSTCPVVTATGVVDPVVSMPPGGFTIPHTTPFELTASATTSGTPTFCWEESDLGPAGAPQSPTGTAPTHRSWDPSTSPTRIFPRLSDLLLNRNAIGDKLPTYARTMSFKCTVRDVQAGGTGIAKGSLAFSVAANGPFRVTNPDSSGSWTALSTQPVTWDPAGTTAAPVSCPNVDIFLSVDGGLTWPYTLATATPNDGSATVTVPDTTTALARVKVKASNNVFFDLTNLSFPISPRTDVAVRDLEPNAFLLHARPNPAASDATISFELPRSGVATLKVFDAAGRLVRTLIEGELAAGHHERVWNGRDQSGREVSSGVYLYQLTTGGQTVTGRVTMLK